MAGEWKAFSGFFPATLEKASDLITSPLCKPILRSPFGATNLIMTVEYEKQTLDHPNPIARYAHRARFARSKKIVLSRLEEGSVIVDYGCGQGRFLYELNQELKEQGKECKLYGYDPYMAAKFDGYEVVANADSIKDSSVSIITSLEVCEHLDEKETHEFLDFVTAKLMQGGTLLVTVPIMMGPAAFIKELSRSLLFRRLPDVRMRDLILASVFGKVPPRAENIKTSHRGMIGVSPYEPCNQSWCWRKWNFLLFHSSVGMETVRHLCC